MNFLTQLYFFNSCNFTHICSVIGFILLPNDSLILFHTQTNHQPRIRLLYILLRILFIILNFLHIFTYILRYESMQAQKKTKLKCTKKKSFSSGTFHCAMLFFFFAIRVLLRTRTYYLNNISIYYGRICRNVFSRTQRRDYIKIKK